MVTRGIPRKTSVDDAGRDRLSDCGFLPPWLRGIGKESKELSYFVALASAEHRARANSTEKWLLSSCRSN